MAPVALTPLLRTALAQTWAGADDLENLHNVATTTQALPKSHHLPATAFHAEEGSLKEPLPPAKTGKDVVIADDEHKDRIGSGLETDKGEKDDQEGMPENAGPSLDDMLAARNVVHREYKVLVDTGQMPSSFTHGDVFIQLLGNRGKSGLIKLKSGFNAMSRIEFSVFTVDVGRVEHIRLVQNSTDRWFCDRVWLSAPEGNREFPVGQFIGFPSNPEVVVGPALASLGPLAVPLALAFEMCKGLLMPSLQSPSTPTSEVAGMSQVSRDRRLGCGQYF